MYFVNREELDQTLSYFDQLISLYKNLSINSELDKKALERIVHLMIETVLDTGNMLIDGFIMRDPGSYIDIIHILVDEKVFSENDKEAYEQLIELRKMLVVDYKTIDHRYVSQIIDRHLNTYAEFSNRVRTYFQQETGVANTFTETEKS